MLRLSVGGQEVADRTIAKMVKKCVSKQGGVSLMKRYNASTWMASRSASRLQSRTKLEVLYTREDC
jgi:hypothetical protein